MPRRLNSDPCSINVALLLWTAPEELVGMGLDGRGGEGPGLDGRGAEGPGLDGRGAEGPGLDGRGAEGPGREGSGPVVCNL